MRWFVVGVVVAGAEEGGTVADDDGWEHPRVDRGVPGGDASLGGLGAIERHVTRSRELQSSNKTLKWNMNKHMKFPNLYDGFSEDDIDMLL